MSREDVSKKSIQIQDLTYRIKNLYLAGKTIELAFKGLATGVRQSIKGQQGFGKRLFCHNAFRKRLEEHASAQSITPRGIWSQGAWQKYGRSHGWSAHVRSLLARPDTRMASTTIGSTDKANLHHAPANDSSSTSAADQKSSEKMSPAGIGLSSENSHSNGTIHSIPAPGQLISHNGKDYMTVKEGLAYILVPPTAKDDGKPKRKPAKGEKNEEHLTNQSVFYNEIMQYNRDLSVLAIRAYGEDWLERQKLKAERKERDIKRGRERAEAKRVRREEEVQLKTQATTPDERPQQHHAPSNQEINQDRSNEVNRTTQPDVVDSTSTARNGTETASDAMPFDVATGSKRPRDSDEHDLEDSEARTKRSKIDDDTRPTTRTAAASSDSDAAKVIATDVSGLDESELLDEDLINVEESANDNRKQGAAPISLRQPHFKVLDALSATGLRALRYAHELPFVTSVVANDLSQKATEMIALNVDHNSLKAKITPVTGNAVAHMYQLAGQEHKGGPGKLYDVVDLDPYGTAVPFLDSAVQALCSGGLLCVTCTDTAVFMSNSYPEKAFSLYGGTSVKGQCAHEGGLRLMLHAIATTAARYGIAIEPLLSLSIDYYARVFVRLKRSPADVKFLMAKTMTLSHCDNGCHAIVPQWLGKSTAAKDKRGQQFWKHGYSQLSGGEFCEHCSFKTHVNGPMWGGPLHNPAFIERILSFLPAIDKSTYPTYERMEGMLTSALEELEIFSLKEKKSGNEASADETVDVAASSLIEPLPSEVRDLHPFYIFPSSLAKTLHCMAPSEGQIRGALRHAGFIAERTHAARGGIKTDAPYSAVWHIMREWVRQKAPIKEGSLKENMAGWKIMYGSKNNPLTAETTVPEADVIKDAGAQQNGDVVALHKPALEHSEPVGLPTTGHHTFPVAFDEELGKDRGKKVKRFQLNPRANWGPMVRAK